MKCWIRRYKINDKNEKEFVGYFSKHLNINMNQNHWVRLRQEAKKFFDGRKANATIRKYKLKNCEVEYER